jgi:protein gp37
MGEKTSISWTDATWNPVRGCSRVSAGCERCYAERVAMRFSGPGQPYEGLVRMRQRNPGADPKPVGWSGNVRMVPDHLADPLRWRRARRIFVNSMSAIEKAVGYVERPGLNWIISGCESGPGARPCEVAWLRSLRDQCKAAGVAYFCKQAADTHPSVYDDNAIRLGPGAKRKAGGVIELPYLDGVQHAAFPEVRT